MLIEVSIVYLFNYMLYYECYIQTIFTNFKKDIDL